LSGSISRRWTEGREKEVYTDDDEDESDRKERIR
jgi:hypothetical protein